MTAPGRRSGADEVLAAQLAAGLTYAEAASNAHVSERTARRRMSDAPFRARVAEIRADFIRRASGLLAEGTVAAAETLTELLSSEAPSIRLRAAMGLLDQAARTAELIEVTERLATLEARLDELASARLRVAP